MSQRYNQGRIASVGQAANMAMDKLEQAGAMARRSREQAVPQDVQFRRYQMLANNPQKLFEFVRKSTGMSDQESVVRGAAAYLDEMERRFGKEGLK